MTTYLGKSCSFCLPRVPFVNCRQFMYLVISLLVLRAGYGIWLYQFLIIAYIFTLPNKPPKRLKRLNLWLTRTQLSRKQSSNRQLRLIVWLHGKNNGMYLRKEGFSMALKTGLDYKRPQQLYLAHFLSDHRRVRISAMQFYWLTF